MSDSTFFDKVKMQKGTLYLKLRLKLYLVSKLKHIPAHTKSE